MEIHRPLPQPLFPRRSSLIQEGKETCTLTFLNESWTFPTGSFDWRPTDLRYGTRLWLLNLHYMEYLEDCSHGTFVSIIDDWIDHVVPYQSRYWLDTWNSFALSTRCVVWMQQYALREDRLSKDFRERMLTSIVQQLRFLTEHLETDIGGNHLVRNVKALLWAGRFWECEEAKAWQELGKKILAQELGEQILGDGMHYERSPAYHVQVFADLLECYAVLPEDALKYKLENRLSEMSQIAVDLTHPDGKTSLFGDGGMEMGYSPETCVQMWEELSEESVDSRKAFALPEAGYYGFRSEEEYVLVDGGKVAPDELPAHGHGDIFSFEWTLDAQRVVVDTGVYEYNPGVRRAYSRSTRAHNTVTVGGEDQCEFWDAFRIGRRAQVSGVQYQEMPVGFQVDGCHDGYRHLSGKPLHERTFLFREGLIRVADEIRGGEGQRVEARLLIHPDCSVEMRGKALTIYTQAGEISLETTSPISLHDAQWFPKFGVEYSGKQIVLRYGNAPCHGEFQLVRAGKS